MQNLLRLKKLVYKVAWNHLGGLELAFPLHFTPFRLALLSVTGSAPVEQEGLCTQQPVTVAQQGCKDGWFCPLLVLSEQASEGKQLRPDCSIIKLNPPG